MKDLNLLVKNIERDLLINIVLSVKHGRITKSEGRKIAGEFLSMSFEDNNDFFEKLRDLSKFREVRKVYVKYAPVYFLEKDEIDLKKLRNFMKSNNFKGENYGNR